MAWYWIVLITLLVVWSVSLILAQFNEEYVLYWAVGLVYPIMLVLLYPLRACLRYNRSRGYYQKHNISKIQYVFGKRPKESD